MIEITQSRKITDQDNDTVKRAEKAAREYQAEKELQRIGVEDQEIDYAEELEEARYVYKCGGIAVERLDEPKETTENEDRLRKCRKESLEKFLSENEGKDLTDPFNIKQLQTDNEISK